MGLPSGAGVAARGEGKRKLMPAAAVFRAIDDQDGTGGGQVAGVIAAVVDVDRISAERGGERMPANAGELDTELVGDLVAGRDVIEYESWEGISVLLKLYGDAAGRGVAVIGDGRAHPHFDAGGANARL